MGYNVFLAVMACLVVVAYIAVTLTRETKSNANKQIQPKERQMEAENSELFFIEYIPAEMRKLEIGGFEASAKAQAELLQAGFTLLRKLPTEIRDSLNCPVSNSLTRLLAQGDNPRYFTPELVRAAVGIAEASLAFWALMFEFDKRVSLPQPVAWCERMGALFAGKQIWKVRYVIERIGRGTGVSFAVATAMWEGIVEMLRDGLVNVPGLKAAKMPTETLGEK
jgi:hypothetical protein